jgi:hypothetical protein
MELLGYVGHVKSCFGLFGEGVSEDSCTVCAKCTIGLGIVLDKIDGTPR